MVITVNDLRESTYKLLELISEFSKILAYSINLKTQLYSIHRNKQVEVGQYCIKILFILITEFGGQPLKFCGREASVLSLYLI